MLLNSGFLPIDGYSGSICGCIAFLTGAVTRYTPMNMSAAENSFTGLKASLPKPIAKTVAKNGWRYIKTATVVGLSSFMESRLSRYVRNVEITTTKATLAKIPDGINGQFT